ncbi:MAG: hypothetical protein JWQ71_3965 [Pedosphaera sp.]|nr:hypothetical protein [Pedosphaera sp.]
MSARILVICAPFGEAYLMLGDLVFDSKRLGQSMRNARNLLGISLRHLSTASGVSTSQILRVESGEYDCTLTTLVRLCGPLGIKYGSLLEHCITIDISIYDVAAKREYLEEPSDLYRSSDERKLKAFLNLVSSSAVVACYLVRSSSPLETVNAFEFPLPEQANALRAFAKNLSENPKPIEDRFGLLTGLQTCPINTLLVYKILTGPLAEKYVAIRIKGVSKPENVELWIPFHYMSVKQ